MVFVWDRRLGLLFQMPFIKHRTRKRPPHNNYPYDYELPGVIHHHPPGLCVVVDSFHLTYFALAGNIAFN